MKILNLSSGGTKFIGLVSKAKAIYSTYNPDVITGVSAGAIASVPIALGLWNEMISTGINLTLDTLFKVSPVNDKGEIRLTKSLFTHGSLGEQRIQELLSNFISPELYEEYKYGNYPTCYVQTVERKTKAKHVWNLKSNLSYEKFLDIVAASAAIPIYTQGIWINDTEHYDGGLKDVIVNTDWIINTLNPSEMVTVYSLPEEEQVNTHHEKIKLAHKWLKFLRLGGLLTDVFEILLEESRITDGKNERLLCKENKIKLTQYYLPRVLEGFYDVDSLKLQQLYNKAKIALPTYKINHD